MKTVATVGRPTDSATHSQTGQKIVVGEPQTVGGRRVQPSDMQTVWSEKIGPQTAPHTIRQMPDTRPDAGGVMGKGKGIFHWLVPDIWSLLVT
ncbi:hypothetical protein J6590_038317 [Homalodisca vitripennis]|nr:hypothetical protein J6590_038317 [Homalodisca vitripennis]